MKELVINGFEGLPLRCYLYEPKIKAKAVVLVIHGMQEHALRYEYFAKKLCESGYVVLLSDLRGHGMTAQDTTKLGVSDGDIFKETTLDQGILLDYLNRAYNLPIYVFAHSYGSMIAQKLMQEKNTAGKYVLCGTANGSSFLFRLANFVTGVLTLFGKKRKATLIEGLTFKTYGKKFKNGNWFTRDEEVFEKYKQDPYCGGSFPYSFYDSLFKNMVRVNRGIKRINSATQIMLIAGKDDMIGERGKQVEKLYKIYLKKGKNAQIKLYENCRHELINELNKDEIISNIIEFYER